MAWLDFEGKELDKMVGGRHPASDDALAETFNKHAQGNAKRNLEKLQELLAAAKPGQQPALLATLGRVRDASAAETLMKYVQNAEAPVTVRSAAILAMGGQDSNSTELVALLSDKNAQIRGAAMTALRTQGPIAAGALLDAMASDDADHTWRFDR